MMNKIKSFRDLDIWKKGMEVIKDIYHITKDFPKNEVYGLTSQIRRSAVSIPSNVAEGFLRKHNAEYIQFLRIALGSTGELETQVEISRMLEYISKEQNEALLKKLEHIRRMILNLIKCLK